LCHSRVNNLHNLCNLWPYVIQQFQINATLYFYLLFFLLFLLFFIDTHPITNSYSVICKAVKNKDDGKNGYNIHIGNSQFGINDCIIGNDRKDIILGGDDQDYIRGKDGDDNLQG
jgi:hypothetical protein